MTIQGVALAVSMIALAISVGALIGTLIITRGPKLGAAIGRWMDWRMWKSAPPYCTYCNKLMSITTLGGRWDKKEKDSEFYMCPDLNLTKWLEHHSSRPSHHGKLECEPGFRLSDLTHASVLRNPRSSSYPSLFSPYMTSDEIAYRVKDPQYMHELVHSDQADMTCRYCLSRLRENGRIDVVTYINLLESLEEMGLVE